LYNLSDIRSGDFHVKEEAQLMRRRNIMLSALVLMVAAALFFLPVFSKTVIVSDQGFEKEIAVRGKTVAEALKEAGYDLKPSDGTLPERDEKLKNGMTIEIQRAFPILLMDGGRMDIVNTLGLTVGEVLEAEKINLSAIDSVEPDLGTIVEKGDKISITRVSKETVQRIESIEYSTEIRKNPNFGTEESLILQKGVYGEKLSTYMITYENGVKADEEKLSEIVVSDPVNKIIEKGDGSLIVASRGDFRYEKSMIMTSTAYDLSVESCGKTPDHPEYGITYSGTRAKRGTVAVDPGVIPLGTRLYIESLDGRADYGFAVAEDTGSAVKGNIIDLFMESESDVAAYGKRKVRVYIIE